MHIYIIRHGHKANQEPGYDGGFNTPLSERGKQQAEHVGEFMADMDLDCLYSSCQLRALQTAEPIHWRIDKEWNVWPVFREINGDTLAEYRAKNPETIEEVTTWPTGESIDTPTEADLEEKHGYYYLLSDIPEMFPGARLTQPFPYPDAWWVPDEEQTYTMGFARVELGARALVDRHNDDERVAVVCHNGSGNMLVKSVLGLPAHPQFLLRFEKAGITRLDTHGHGGGSLKAVNRMEHLPDDLRV